MVILVKSCMLTWISLLCFRKIAIKIGWVDCPGGRKKHQTAVPVVGGLSVFLAISIILSNTLGASYWVLWLGCCSLVGLSCLDDKFSIRPNYRFILHSIIIMLVLLFSHTRIAQVGDILGVGSIVLGNASLLFTVFAVVGVMNAVNMMDGIDGLTGCISLAELGWLLMLALYGGFNNETFLIMGLIGALVAFLCFNFPTKIAEQYKVFLGDTGSLLIGLLIAWLCVSLTQNSKHAYPPVLMLWIMALPLMDTVRLILSRKARKVSPFKADRRHIHHILLRLHLSVRQTICILSMASLSLGLLGISLYKLGATESVLFTGILLIFGAYYILILSLERKLAQHHDLKRYILH